MALDLLDPYRESASLIHRSDARVKLALALLLILAIQVTPVAAWPVHVGYLGLILAAILLARLSPLRVVGRSALALPFVFMAAAGLPFVRDGEPLVKLDMLGLPVTMTDVGLLRFANILLKAWLSVLVSVTLIFTTHFTALVRAMRSFGVPLVLTSVIAMMYRYLFVLVDETRRLMTAREARSAEPEGGRAGRSLWWRAQVTGNMIGTLFLRTYERSERIYNAMLARGFSGEIRVLHENRLARRELGVASTVAVLLVAAAALANVAW
ncbi:MAG: cobalt ECF transporter T component CbiQ [Chloroflexi bacterium]|nr:cobalt ECF transporter T component CbiQ [Chloroflexota bacterium]